MDKPLRLIIVDDSKDDAFLIINELRRNGFSPEAIRVDNPADFRHALLDSRWDIVTSDHSMPDFSAPEVLAITEEMRPDLPVIIVSGEIDIRLAVSLMKSGARDYVQKMDIARLPLTIERELRELAMKQERNTIAHTLLEKEELLSITLQSIGDAVISTDVQGLIVHMNPVAESLTGWTLAEAKARPLDQVLHLIHSQSRQPIESPVQKVLREGQVIGLTGDTLLIAKNGDEHPIADRGAPILDTDGTILGVVLVFRDQREEVDREKALRTSESRLRKAEIVAGIGHWAYSLSDQMVLASKGAQHIYGVDHGFWPYQLVQSISLPHYRVILDDAMNDLIAGRRPYDVTFQMTRQSDGALRDIHSIAEFDAEQQVVFGIIKDITNLKRSEEAVVHSRDQLRLQSRVADLILTDPSDGVLSAVLQEVLKHFDSPNGMIGYLLDPASMFAHFLFYDLYHEKVLDSLVTPIPVPPPESMWGQCVTSGVSIISNLPDDTAPCQLPLSRTICVPIKNVDSILGIIAVANRCSNYTEDELASLETLAAYIAPIMATRMKAHAAETALRTSEERHRKILDNAPLGFIHFDVTGKIIAANDYLLRAINTRLRDATGMNLGDFGDPRLVASLNTILSGRESTFEGFYKPLYGEEEVPVRAKFVPIFDEAGNVVSGLAMIEDMREYLQSEALLHEQLGFTQTLMDTIPFPVFHKDQEGKYTGCNRAFESFFGITAEDLLGKTVFEIWPPEMAEIYYEADRELYRLPERQEYETTVIRYDGYPRHVIMSKAIIRSRTGDIQGVLGVITDITDRKEAERRFQSYVENAPDGIVVVDPLGRFIEVNDAVCRMVGYTREALLSRTVFDIITPEGRDNAQNHLAEIFSNGSYTGFLSLDHADGTPRYIRLNGVRLSDSSSLCFAIDISDLKHMEEDLRTSEARYRSLFENMQHGVSVFDLTEDGKDLIYKNINKTAERILGIQRKTLIGKSLFEVRKFLDRNATLELLRPVIHEGRTLKIPSQHYQDENLHGWFEASILKLPSGELVLLFDNVTHRYQMEAASLLNEERLQSLLDLMHRQSDSPESLMDYALEQAIALTRSHVGGLFVYDFDQQVYRLNNWSRGTEAECRITDKMRTDELPRYGLWWETVRLGQPFILNDYPADHPQKTGYPEGHIALRRFITIPVFSGGQIAAVVGMGNKPDDYDESDVRQITLLMDAVWKIIERKKAESALRESEEKYRRLYEEAALGIFTSNIGGRFIEINPAFAAMLGYDSPGEAVSGISDIATQLYADPNRRKYILEEIMQTGRLTTIETLARRRDGSLWHALMHLHVVFDDERQPKYIQGFAEDITQRKLQEDEIKRLTESLERRVEERTAELQSFVHSVSHDLRAPLRAMRGFASILMQDYGQDMDETAQDLLTRIIDAGHHQADLMDALLQLSRLSYTDLEISACNLSEIAEEIIVNLQENDPERTVHIFIQPEMTVKADRRLMTIVMQNLIGNAWKYTARRQTAHIEIGSMIHPSGFAYYVRDNGAGFSMKYVSRIFEVFQRLHSDEEYTGHGVGLSIVRRIIERHGGKIWANSEPDRGAEFFFTMGKHPQ